MATMAFNKFFTTFYEQWRFDNIDFPNEFGDDAVNPADLALNEAYIKALQSGAMFDARCFNIPKEEVCNLVYWRQLDATRNSIQMVGQANFSHNELQGKSCNMIQDMLYEQRGINWNDFETRWKRGVAWTKATGIDWDMPILKGEDRAYVDNLIYVGG